MKSSNRAIHRLTKWGISKLPFEVKAPLIRGQVSIDGKNIDSFSVKIAETPEEFEAAFKLARASYVARGFERLDAPLRLNKYQLANSSAVIIAKSGDKVIGTLSIVKKAEIGLPLERLFSVNKNLPYTHAAAEVTNLAIDPLFRRKNGFNCLFPLMKYIYKFATDHMKVDHLFLTCLPKDADFYSALLFFREINGLSYTDNYMGYPANCMVLDLKDAPQMFKEIYGGNPLNKNFYNYFIFEKFDYLLYPSLNDEQVYSDFNNTHYEYFLKRGYDFDLLILNEHIYFQKQFSKNLVFENKKKAVS